MPDRAFTLNGTERSSAAPTRRLIETAQRYGVEIPHLCYKEGMRADGNCRACMVEIKGERVLAPSCCRYPEGRHGGDDRQRAGASPARRWCSSCCCRTFPRRPTRSTPSSIAGRRSSRSASRASRARHQPPQDLSHPAIAVHLDACIQCGRCVRACREEQVNDVIGYAFRGEHVEDRVRPRRSDGRLDVRRLRRMRAGVPDRRADAGARRRHDRRRQAGRLGVPVLRRRLPAHLPRQGQHDPLRAGQGRPGELEPAVRQGPLRLRLRAAQASPHHAAASASRASQKHKDFAVDPDNWRERVPRGDAGTRRSTFAAKGLRDIRDTHGKRVARRFRLGEGHERRGVSVPEAGAHRLRLEQRRSLHAPVPRLERRGADGRHQLGRGLEPGARRRERRGDLRHRREPDGEPSGRRDLDEERRARPARS